MDAVKALLQNFAARARAAGRRGGESGHKQCTGGAPASQNFTDNGRGLLLGVNIGGLGTPVASLASLISFKLYSHAEHSRPGAFMSCFLAVNLGLLAVLLAFARWIS